MRALFKRATSSPMLAKQWATESSIAKLDLMTQTEQSIMLRAPISEVQKLLAKQLKPRRKLLSVVRFGGGKVEEVTQANLSLIETTAADVEEAPAAKPPFEKAVNALAKEAGVALPKKEPAAAATVAVPARGCPQPDFEKVEIRATRVLKEFLSPQQLEDFERYQAFMVIGADTGHRYRVASRHASGYQATYADGSGALTARGHQFFDLDERRSYCVHDWDVPAPEEMLAIMLAVQIPGYERYLRELPPVH